MCDLNSLTFEQLEERRNLLHVQLAAVNELLQRRRALAQQEQQRHRDEWLRSNPDPSLDASSD